jgi:hypothetical protein
MARSEKRSNSKQAIPLTIAEETAIFLKAGGKIQQIPTGVSGQVNLAGPKHIKLGNNNKPNENKPVENKPSEIKPSEIKPSEIKHSEAIEAASKSVKPN